MVGGLLLERGLQLGKIRYVGFNTYSHGRHIYIDATGEHLTRAPIHSPLSMAHSRLPVGQEGKSLNTLALTRLPLTALAVLGRSRARMAIVEADARPNANKQQ